MLLEYSQRDTHRVIGLMAGTSVDGIDVAAVQISGGGETLQAELLHFVTVPFEVATRREILRLCESATAVEVAVWNVRLGELFAEAARPVVAAIGGADLIGSHGQTICHLPHERATLQIGEPSVIAERLGLPVVADFRPRDMAAGGQGAPLVPYVDYRLWRHPTRDRIIQNIGGIANCTLLPAGGTLDDVRAWDTGPGNMVIDECVRQLTNGAHDFDAEGAMAAAGRVDETWLSDLMRHAHFHRPPPVSAGREEFGRFFAEQFITEGRRRSLDDNDIVATATALTAESIAHAYRMFAAPQYARAQLEIVLCGGGAFNPTLRRMLQRRVAPHPVLVLEDLGHRSDAREAIAFAILAHETMLGHTNNVPHATGANRDVVLGRITF